MLSVNSSCDPVQVTGESLLKYADLSSWKSPTASVRLPARTVQLLPAVPLMFEAYIGAAVASEAAPINVKF